MIFSKKIYKITNGENISLYKNSDNKLNLYIFDKTLKNYIISENSNKNCVFQKNYIYSKIIKLSNNIVAIASNNYITILNENEIQ